MRGFSEQSLDIDTPHPPLCGTLSPLWRGEGVLPPQSRSFSGKKLISLIGTERPSS